MKRAIYIFVFAVLGISVLAFCEYWFGIFKYERVQELKNIPIPATQWRLVVEEHVERLWGVGQVFYSIGIKGQHQNHFVTGPAWIQTTDNVQVEGIEATWTDRNGNLTLPGYCRIAIVLRQDNTFTIQNTEK